jgi:hypothetical protein
VLGLEGCSQAGELVADAASHLLVSVGGRSDAECPEQRGGGNARIARFAEYRVEALVG